MKFLRKFLSCDAIKQFIKFGLVGVSNTIVSFIVTYGVVFFVTSYDANISKNSTVLIFIASFCGFAIGVLNSFYWNNKFVFKKTSNGILIPLLKSYVCYGLVFVLSFFLNACIFTKLLNLPNIYIPILQIFICTPLNYISNKMWAFK